MDKKLNHLLASLLMLPTSVFASVAIWQAPYVGGYIGGGFGNNHAATNVGFVTDTSYLVNVADIQTINSSQSYNQHPTAFVGGMQFGHDWVYNQFIYGLVFDFGAMNLTGSRSENFVSSSDVLSMVDTSVSSNWLFTLRGRLGRTYMMYYPSLFYVTGGMAMTKLKVKNAYSDDSALAGGGGNSIAQDTIGWTAGIGFEMMTFDRISLGLEYLFVHIPSLTSSSTISNTAAGFGIPALSLNNPFNTRGWINTNLLKLTANYRFCE